MFLYYEDGKIRWNKDHLSDGVLASPAGHSNTDWDNYGLRSKYDLTLKSLTLTAAFDWWSEGGKTWNVRAADDRRVWGYDGRFNFVSPYLGARYDFALHNDWTLTPAAGLRYYCSSDFDNEAAANLALTLAHEEIAFFTSYARGVHYPGVYVRGVSPLNWPTLTAETLDSLEAGFRYELNEVVALHSSLFRMKVANRLDTAPGGFLNSGAMEAYGLETALHFYPRRDLTIFAGGAYTYRKTRPVSRLPEVTLSAGSSWQINKHLRWEIDAEYVSTQYGYGMRTVNPPLEKIDSFITVNTRLSLDLRALSKLQGEIYVAIDNLTGQHYEYFPGYPLPGTMWYAGLKLKF